MKSLQNQNLPEALQPLMELNIPIYCETPVPLMGRDHIDKLIEPLEEEYIVLYGFDENNNYVGISKDWYVDTIHKRIQSRLPAFNIELYYITSKDIPVRYHYALRIKRK